MDYMLDSPDYVECADCGEPLESRHAKTLTDVTYVRDAEEGFLLPKRTVTFLCSSCHEQHNPNL